MSNEKILLWNKNQILAGDLGADDSSVQVNMLKLKIPSQTSAKPKKAAINVDKVLS